jgi:hypothetical protein
MFVSIREDWCTMENFKIIPEDIHARMVDSGVANEVWKS